jgi:integrase
MRVAIEDELRDDDPTIGVKSFRRKGDGHHSWTDDEIAQFRAKFPLGSRHRLALELLLNTGQRLSDVARMGKQHVKERRIHVRQVKTGKHMEIPIHVDLMSALESCAHDNLTFVMTQFGKPFTSKGFANWFAEGIDAAALPERCVTHGLRKAAARRLAEVGCTSHEIASITGQSLQEVERYTRAADQVRLAEAAIHKLPSTLQEQNLANPSDRLAKSDQK